MSRSSEPIARANMCSPRQAGQAVLAKETTVGQSTPQTLMKRQFQTFSEGTSNRDASSGGGHPLFFKTATPLFEGSRSRGAKKQRFLLRTKRLPLICPSVHSFKTSLGELPAGRGTLSKPKHHDLAYELGVWQRRSSERPKKFRRRSKRGTRMACHIPSTGAAPSIRVMFQARGANDNTVIQG